MEAKDLRLGNVVEHFHDVSGFNDHVIDIDDLNAIVSGDTGNEYEPIPLTEEWLIKFGFDEYHNGWSGWYDKGDFIISNTQEGYCLLFPSTKEKYEYEFLRKIEHVHQLQNLYYALTGEELTINE